MTSLSFINKSYQLILASNSPRRRDLLKQLGYEFKVEKLPVDENYPSDLPIKEVAEYLSCKKAAVHLPSLHHNDIVICADTTVLIDNEILEKPNNEKEAVMMLQKLSGKEHSVISGVCVESLQKKISFAVETKVQMKALSEAEINYYISHFQPFDKAGGYGIQEWIGLIGVEKIEGSFYNVMGLPVKELYETLTQF